MKLGFSQALLIVSLLTPLPFGSRAAGQASTFDDIWRFAQWYSNEENRTVQSVLFTGRFQYEHARVRDDGLEHDEWNVRRMRLGFRSQLFKQLTLHTEAEFNPQEADPFYMRLTDFYVRWTHGAGFAVTVGKHGVPFTLDGATSSKELLTIDRSNLSNNLWFTQEYMPGLSVAGTRDGWSYQLGVYSAGRQNREFGDLDGSGFGLAVLAYDLSDALGVDQARVAGNYVYQNPDPLNTFTRQLRHVTSLNFALAEGPWAARADVSGGWGYLGQSDLWGAVVMPLFNVTPKLQLVARQTYISSANPNGVRLARYESQLVNGRGDRYRESYLGVNYFFYGHKLKLQSGLQFADMADGAGDGGAYSGTSVTTGLRISW